MYYMEMTVNGEKSIVLNVEGMTCTNCALGISKYLEKQGLKDVSVNFATTEVAFQLTGDNKLSDIEAGINGLGYKVVKETVAGEKEGFKFSLEKKFIFCLVFTLPLLLHMFWHADFLMNPYVQLSLSIPVMLVGLWHFGKSGFYSLKSGVANMDVLITIGSSAAFGYSLYGTIMHLGPDFLFYETAATIITLVMLGNLLEHRSVQRTTNSIKELSKLRPQKASIIVNGETQSIDISEVKVGNTLSINSGDRIPLDALVIWGEATVDESMLTGESVPVEKQKNSNLIGGTMLSSGSVQAIVTATGSNTYLHGVIELVKQAQNDKPAIQRIADQVSAIFVPAVLVIAALTFLLSFYAFSIDGTQSLLRSIAVLAIACPCAMGLATPTAVMVGIGKITRQGILIKGGKTIEQLAKVENIVFDKTGTLTTGAFKIDEVKLFKGTEDEALSALYSLEKHSSHPIAKSLVKQLKKYPSFPLLHVKEKGGSGINAEDKNGNQYFVGSFDAARKFTTVQDYDIYIIKNSVLIAAVTISDEIKPEAKETIAFLKSKGINTYMLSGDRYKKCYQVAQELGIETFYAERKPEEKLRLIEQLCTEGMTAMVGDGINDAPALAKADIGISLSNATEVAMDSAQVILLNGNLSHLKGAVNISNITLTTIKQNLFWAFAYNVVAIPIAALGFLNPMIAAMSMAFSDVVVVGNSLRLMYRKVK